MQPQYSPPDHAWLSAVCAEDSFLGGAPLAALEPAPRYHTFSQHLFCEPASRTCQVCSKRDGKAAFRSMCACTIAEHSTEATTTCLCKGSAPFNSQQQALATEAPFTFPVCAKRAKHVLRMLGVYVSLCAIQRWAMGHQCWDTCARMSASSLQGVLLLCRHLRICWSAEHFQSFQACGPSYRIENS